MAAKWFWRWVGRKITPYVPPRAGISITGCVFEAGCEPGTIRIEPDGCTFLSGVKSPYEQVSSG